VTDYSPVVVSASNDSVETLRFLCPNCGTKALDFTHAPHRDHGELVVKIHCHGCAGGLNEVAVASRISKPRLLTWPPAPELGPPLARSRSSAHGVGERPRSAREFRAAVRTLRHSRNALAAGARRIARHRGVRPATAPLGLTHRRGALAFVVRQWVGGQVVSECFRWVDEAAAKARWGRKDDVLYGCRRGWLAYPPPPTGIVYLLAGFWDVLSARQAGLPALSTAGKDLPLDLALELAGRVVAVLFDVGEEEAAERAVHRLHAAGADAWIVHLSLLDLPPGGDVNDFLCGGGTTAELRRLVHAERSRSR
jgi:hypothetical protein